MNAYKGTVIIDRFISEATGRTLISPIERTYAADRILAALTDAEKEAIKYAPHFDHPADENAPAGKYTDWLLDLRNIVEAVNASS